MKWTAFDQETAAALTRHAENVELSQGAGDELDSALDAAAAGPAAALLPAVDGQHALLLTFRTKDAAATTSVPVLPSAYQAGGFLGLADEPVYEDRDK